MREILRLNGMLDEHRFPSGMKTRTKIEQAGNAVPSTFMKLVFENAVESLKRTDSLVPAQAGL